jgi:hypothetical protein
MTKTPIKISTLEEYINFDDGTDKRYEIEDELLVEMPPVRKWEHGEEKSLLGYY